MGNNIIKKSIILTALLLIAASAIRVTQTPFPETYAIPLKQSFHSLNNWATEKDIPLDNDVYNELNLDDYLHRTYVKGKQYINLYIGFYTTAEKIGDAHDPLVCFPGQGWVVDFNKRNNITIMSRGNFKLHYASFVATRGDDSEMVAYWFQSFDRPNSSTFEQKLSAIVNRIRNLPTSNAFVRISTRIENSNVQTAIRTIESFLQEFYPAFHRYITKTSLPM